MEANFNYIKVILFLHMFFLCSCATKKCNMANKFLKKENLDEYYLNDTKIDTIQLIGCLIRYGNNHKYNGQWSIYVNDSLKYEYDMKKSTNLPDPKSVNSQVALYLISALYNRSYNFCDEMSIVETDGENNSYYIFSVFKRNMFGKIKPKKQNKTVLKNLYNIYQDWFDNLEKYDSLDDAKKDKLSSPLSNSKYSWYKMEMKIQ